MGTYRVYRVGRTSDYEVRYYADSTDVYHYQIIEPLCTEGEAVALARKLTAAETRRLRAAVRATMQAAAPQPRQPRVKEAW